MHLNNLNTNDMSQSPDDLPGRLISYKEAARILNCSMRGFYNIIERGDLPIIKIGGMRRIDSRTLTAFIRNNTTCADQGCGTQKADVE